MVVFREIYQVYMQLLFRLGVKQMTIYELLPRHLYQPPEEHGH